MRINLQDDEQPEIGLIALIDCIFFLLMFFMITTSFKTHEQVPVERKIPIELPTAQVSLDQATAAPAPFVLSVDRNGEVYVDGTKVTLQALHAVLKAEAARHPGRPVRVDGDRAASYQDIVHVLELCQFEGLTQVSMQIR